MARTQYDGRHKVKDYAGSPPDDWEEEPEEPTPDPKPSSGVNSLVLAAVTVARPSSAQQITSWRADAEKPHPLIVIVNVRGPAANSNAAPYASELAFRSQCSGGAQGTGTELGGVLRITYGFEQALRVLEADLQSGVYQLPPCNSAQVEGFFFLTGPASCDVQASIVPGWHPEPSRLHASFRSTIAAGASVTERVPFGARWVSLNGGGATAIAAGQPQIALSQPNGPLILQDYAAGVFVGGPGQAVELGGREDVTITNFGAAPVSVTTRFFLEA